jgi:hypothetical protein
VPCLRVSCPAWEHVLFECLPVLCLKAAKPKQGNNTIRKEYSPMSCWNRTPRDLFIRVDASSKNRECNSEDRGGKITRFIK